MLALRVPEYPGMSFPANITVRVTPSPPPGLAVRIVFRMLKKINFNYTVFVGSNGVANLSAEELLTAFDETRSVFLMDYVDPRSHFSGEITAEVLNGSDLSRAIDAFELFRGQVSFPPDYEKNLGNAASKGQSPENYRVSVVSS